ncbi:hypothetical protein [Nocardia sp. NPDC051463]|uniref:hypothetical protein n=1 Tax=Nocardia sp. NPDC051463 TaxID=3154845 RepID=UPI0034402478
MTGGTIGLTATTPAAAISVEVAPVPPALSPPPRALHRLPASLIWPATTGSTRCCAEIT